MFFKLNSTRIVIDSTLEVMTQGIEITSIIVEIGVLGRKVNGIREITKNVSRLKFDIRALGCIELIDLRLTDGTLPVSQRRSRVYLKINAKIVDGIIEICIAL